MLLRLRARSDLEDKRSRHIQETEAGHLGVKMGEWGAFFNYHEGRLPPRVGLGRGWGDRGRAGDRGRVRRPRGLLRQKSWKRPWLKMLRTAKPSCGEISRRWWVVVIGDENEVLLHNVDAHNVNVTGRIYVAAHNVSIQNIKVSKCERHITYSVTKHTYVL
jgi:hypothetical protein